VAQVELTARWRRYAACRDAPTTWFFAADDREKALALCGRCPVSKACLDWADATGQADGVWGGRTPFERGVSPRPLRRGSRLTVIECARCRRGLTWPLTVALPETVDWAEPVLVDLDAGSVGVGRAHVRDLSGAEVLVCRCGTAVGRREDPRSAFVRFSVDAVELTDRRERRRRRSA
jgi:WhiB family transcriptional regulator, redox-sensing transcriptional regulator